MPDEEAKSFDRPSKQGDKKSLQHSIPEVQGGFKKEGQFKPQAPSSVAVRKTEGSKGSEN